MFTYNHAEDLATIEESVREAIAAIPRYQPKLESPSPAASVLIYVMHPDPAAEVIGDFVFAASPFEFYLMLRGREALGGGPVDCGDIAGIFPLHEPDEALSLAYSLMDERPEPAEEAGS
jgi:hypothetical protein